MRHLLFLVATALTWPTVAHAEIASEKIVTAIIRADYEGDRVALDKLYNDLKAVRPADGNRRQAAQLHYGLGCAKWRRTINGFNENANMAELEADLNTAVSEFEAARAADPAFTDASVSMLGCLQNLIYVHRNDKEKSGQVVQRFLALFKELQQIDPNNPRFAWLDGGGQLYMAQFAKPEERASKQAAAFETYRRGLERARAQKRPASVLEPSWGEPELLMSMSWARLNQEKPDVAAAEKYALEALAIAPHWHYLKNVQMPQIQKAKTRN